MPRHKVSHRTQPQNVARGCVNTQRRQWRQIVCAFDHDTFDAIRARAVREGTSFAEQVRLLCEWGLEAGKDDHGKAR